MPRISVTNAKLGNYVDISIKGTKNDKCFVLPRFVQMFSINIIWKFPTLDHNLGKALLNILFFNFYSILLTLNFDLRNQNEL